MKWEVNVPLFSIFCPNDTCKVWKQGCNIRMDYTFVQQKGFTTVRAPTSFIYLGETGKTYLINWEKKTWFDQFEPLDSDEKDLIINDIMDGTRLNSEFKVKSCAFTPSLNWRSKPVIEKINNWKSQKYNVKVEAFFDLHHQLKTEYCKLGDKESYFDTNKPILKQNIFVNSNDEAKKKIAKNLHLNNDMMKKQLENFGKNQKKNLTAIVWVAENYPFKLEYMVNMINSLSNANDFIEKLKEFIKDPEFLNIMAKGGFPIKIQIPINFLIDVTMTFTEYK